MRTHTVDRRLRESGPHGQIFRLSVLINRIRVKSSPRGETGEVSSGHENYVVTILGPLPQNSVNLLNIMVIFYFPASSN
jgi:hypothetical protein